MPSDGYNATRAALRQYSRRQGPAKAYTSALPLVRVTPEMDAAVRAAAEVMGVSIAEVARIALSDFLGVPREAPTVDNPQGGMTHGDTEV